MNGDRRKLKEKDGMAGKKKEYVIDTVEKNVEKSVKWRRRRAGRRDEGWRENKWRRGRKKKKRKMSSRFWRPEIYLARVVLPFAACNRCRKTQSAYLRGIIKSAREEWPRNTPGNGKMAIASFCVTRIVDPSRTKIYSIFDLATRFPPFAFNSSSRLRRCVWHRDWWRFRKS